MIDSYNNDKTDTKSFCIKYCGCFDSQDGIKYITDSDFFKWVKTIYKTPFLKHIDFSDSLKLKINFEGNVDKDSISVEDEENLLLSIVNTKIYKDKDCLHTVVFVK